MSIWHRLLPGCPERLAAMADDALDTVRQPWAAVDERVLLNQGKVLQAFHAAGIADVHFAASTGYGYGDIGREKIDEVFAAVFRAEAALVRIQFASGTHAIACALFGALRPGDRLISAAGAPYDTLRRVIGDASGGLGEWGIAYEEIPLLADGGVDLPALVQAVQHEQACAVFIQRSRGYSPRPSLTVSQIGRIVAEVRRANPAAICIVDNCYGEFVEELEPTEVGADLVCGSLIKNPGGGLVPTGGYVAGRAHLVRQAAARLIAPGIGTEVGASLGVNRLILQGLFLAPHTTGEALKGAHFAAAFFGGLGLAVRPEAGEYRTDLVQMVEMGSAEALIAFCEAVQRASPVDAHVRPEPWDMPGYTDRVIMAAGTFVQGSSIELSADGPMRPPYAAYFQGGLTREHVMYAAVSTAARLAQSGILRL